MPRARLLLKAEFSLEQVEEICNEASLAIHDISSLSMQLSEIDGFGPITRSNVLVCMGFDQVIPSDFETIRNLKRVNEVVHLHT